MRYTIKPGDTLSALAKKHNTTVALLATANDIKNPDKIYAGHTIWVPDSAPISWDFWDSVRRWLWR